MKTRYLLLIACVLGAFSCTKNSDVNASKEVEFNINMAGTKVTGTSFQVGDALSLWAVEREGGVQQPLQIGGNYFNDEKLSFNGTKWLGERSLYWSTLACDFYAVYPYVASISSVEEQPIQVTLDQDSAPAPGQLGGYEASDFMWASAENRTRTAGAVPLSFRHMMSKCVVNIVKGEKFEGDIPDDIVVHIYNTTTSGKLNLAKGSVSKDAFGSKKTITAKKINNQKFEAVLIPQNIEKRTPLIEVTMGGIAYLLEYSLSFRPGYKHTINLTVNTSPDQEKIDISIDAGQGDWD